MFLLHLTFAIRTKLFQELTICFLLLEHSLFLHVLSQSSLQPATAPHQRFKVSTSPNPSDFFTGPILFFIKTAFILSSAHLPVLQARFFTAFCWCDFCQTQKKGTKSTSKRDQFSQSQWSVIQAVQMNYKVDGKWLLVSTDFYQQFKFGKLAVVFMGINTEVNISPTIEMKGEAAPLAS